MEAHKAGSCDAMITWFDTIFRERCDRPVVFTTGPQVMRKCVVVSVYVSVSVRAFARCSGEGSDDSQGLSGFD